MSSQQPENPRERFQACAKACSIERCETEGLVCEDWEKGIGPRLTTFPYSEMVLEQGFAVHLTAEQHAHLLQRISDLERERDDLRGNLAIVARMLADAVGRPSGEASSAEIIAVFVAWIAVNHFRLVNARVEAAEAVSAMQDARGGCRE